MGHLKAHRIGPEEAYMKCEDKEKFRPFLRTPPADFTEV
jgi:twitching motility protein PilT